MTLSRAVDITVPEPDVGNMAPTRWPYVTRSVLVMPGCAMALDRPDDDFGVGDARPEQHLRDCASGGEVSAARSEPAEPRTREEYYEALRSADGGRWQEGDDPPRRTTRPFRLGLGRREGPPGVGSVACQPRTPRAHTGRRRGRWWRRRRITRLLLLRKETNCARCWKRWACPPIPSSDSTSRARNSVSGPDP